MQGNAARALSKRGTELLAATAEGYLQHWNVQNGKLLHSILLEDELFCAEFSRNGKYFFAGGSNRVIYCYDEATRQPVIELSFSRLK